MSGPTDGYVAVIGGLPATSVPEPATWAMMLVGLGGIGVTMRSRRKVNVASVD
jgi:uncharacterized membrane protein YccC